jgi:hypothetical protein
MTDTINAKSEALELRECSSKELDAVSGGSIGMSSDKIKALEVASSRDEGTSGPAGGPMGIMFQQFLQQLQG